MPELRLNQDNFDEATRLAGCLTEAARAELIGVTERTLNRVRRGVIGHEFITKTLVALRPYERKLAKMGLKPTFETFFEVE